MTKPGKRVPSDWIIFDGNNAAHRLSAATQPLTNPKGERVEVVFGLLRLVSSVMRNNPAKKCYLVWDGKDSKKRRQNWDPLYKTNRGKDFTDEDRARIENMHVQIQMFWELFGQYLPIHWLISQKYEADDLMAMLAFEAEDRHKTSLIVSGDKDMLQLVSKHAHIWSPMKSLRVDLSNFQEVTGYPDGLAFLYGKCLQGDTSDNIPGIRGIGEKTALKILSEHHWDLGAIMDNSYGLLGKTAVGQKLLEDSAKARIKLNYSLQSLISPLHCGGITEKWEERVEIRTGNLNTPYLKGAMVRQAFASILGQFQQWIDPFMKLEE
jgi:5'-3' exonuclease